MLDTVKVTFENGDVIITDFNAQVSREEMTRYYMGNYFNLGSVRDNMQKAVKVEFPDSEGKFKTDEDYKALIKDAEINIA